MRPFHNGQEIEFDAITFSREEDIESLVVMQGMIQRQPSIQDQFTVTVLNTGLEVQVLLRNIVFK